jgi:hypothetical protein
MYIPDTFLHYNVDEGLSKFGVHIASPQYNFPWNEKWNSLVLVPVKRKEWNEYILINFSDNDSLT